MQSYGKTIAALAISLNFVSAYHEDTYYAICPIVNSPKFEKGITGVLIAKQQGDAGELMYNGRLMGLDANMDYFTQSISTVNSGYYNAQRCELP